MITVLVVGVGGRSIIHLGFELVLISIVLLIPLLGVVLVGGRDGKVGVLGVTLRGGWL